MDYSNLILKTVQLTQQVREERIRNLRVKLTKTKIERYQQVLIDQLNVAISKNIKYQIDDLLGQVEDII